MKRKINIIDVIIILIVIAVIIGCYSHFSKDSQSDQVNNIFKIGKEKVTFVLEGDNIRPELTDKISINDKLIANGNYQDAIVTNVEVYDHEIVVAVDGKIKAVNDPTVKRVVVTIEANVNRYGPYMDIGGQLIKSSVNFWFRTDKMTMLSKVVGITEIKVDN
ncbi:hypothetical protein SH1V18_28390 [Vallitalea longa]|uniref:DUF4330 domain-containing protein n=1 Tax=Vallitalea longa TaxID=2936439 RepID=A0A9W5YC23_9FIRM|nr:DUF4330 family protein [Vallitalea longa]GKX30359.1 hypothetical protein SH1V18_28390 [Vallitalea longa]